MAINFIIAPYLECGIILVTAFGHLRNIAWQRSAVLRGGGMSSELSEARSHCSKVSTTRRSHIIDHSSTYVDYSQNFPSASRAVTSGIYAALVLTHAIIVSFGTNARQDCRDYISCRMCESLLHGHHCASDPNAIKIPKQRELCARGISQAWTVGHQFWHSF
ncbi:hypothetical protein BDR03DRAFT_700142 [Suillus americanus]|nr:hypothetical protein BDR03DRAFT_700142 [Suillus americanus]